MLGLYTSASFTNVAGVQVASLASVEVRRESDNGIAVIYTDVDGVTLLSNPFTADDQGRFAFSAAGLDGGYKVRVYKGSSEHIARHQQVGSAGYFDASSAIGPLLNSVDAATFLTALGGATQAYVDNIATGLDVKASVRCATTGNIALSGEQTIDGVLTTADRVLVKNQTAPAENGIYVSAAGAWTRALDMNAWVEVPGSFVFVEEGSTLADTGWVATANEGGTLDTTAITWAQFSGIGTFQPLDATLTALAALTIAANSLSIGSGADAFNQVTFGANTFPGRGSAGDLVAKVISDDALAFIAAANNAAMRTALGAQTLDATLTALAALTIAAESLTIGTGADAFTQVAFAANTFPARASAGSLVAKAISDFALTFLDDADAPTVRQTLGILEVIMVAASDEVTNISAGTAKVKWRMPYAFTVTAVRASLSTAQASGSIFTVDINEDGVSILSTKLTIDNTELTSTTAATAPVISDTALADDAEMSVDVDQIGTAGARGLKVYLIGRKTA